MEQALTEEDIKKIRKNQYTHLVIGLALLLLASGWFILGYYSRHLQTLIFGVLVLGAVFTSRSLLKIIALNRYIKNLEDKDHDVLDG